MYERTVVVGSRVGLHARPATTIADAADELGSEVFIGLPDDEAVEANSALLIMSLGAGPGAEVVVSGEQQADVDVIAALIEKDLDA
jgi:phosphocarrier protein